MDVLLFKRVGRSAAFRIVGFEFCISEVILFQDSGLFFFFFLFSFFSYSVFCQYLEYPDSFLYPKVDLTNLKQFKNQSSSGKC